MQRIIKTVILIFAAAPLMSCAARKPTVPEWKSVYLQLVMDGIMGTRDLPGVAANYGIELYDMDLDGVPELQECVTVHNNDYSMWFFDDGAARQIIGRISFRPDWRDTVAFVNLFRHNETGEVVAVHAEGNAFFTDEFCFVTANDKLSWDLDSIWSTAPFRIDIPQTKYTRTDAYGSVHVITEQEYQAWVDSISNEYTRLVGEFISLKEFFRYYGESGETFSLKIEKAPKVISDYFDSYDGIPSAVYKEYKLPDATGVTR